MQERSADPEISPWISLLLHELLTVLSELFLLDDRERGTSVLNFFHLYILPNSKLVKAKLFRNGFKTFFQSGEHNQLHVWALQGSTLIKTWHISTDWEQTLIVKAQDCFLSAEQEMLRSHLNVPSLTNTADLDYFFKWSDHPGCSHVMLYNFPK